MEHSLHQIQSIDNLYNYFAELNLNANSRPVRKIIHSILKKTSEFTILKVENYDSSLFQHYYDECNLYNNKLGKVYALHFFEGIFNSLEKLKETKKRKYYGVCLLRGTGSVCYSFINSKIIIRADDKYAYLVTRILKEIEILPEFKREISGFPYIEKDKKGVMCAQASLAIILEYWDNKYSKNKTINFTAASITDFFNFDQEKLDRCGLGRDEIEEFMEDQVLDYAYDSFLTYKVKSIERKMPETDIYSYMDSKFPVYGIVKGDGGFHALTIIGHTFERHDWEAMASEGYYIHARTGAGRFFSNLKWIRHLIIQDDNFGPYFFLPVKLLPEIIVEYYVLLPDPKIKLLTPKQAEHVGFVGIKTLIESHYKGIIESGILPQNNHKWGERLLDYAINRDFDLVLRTRYENKEKIISRYKAKNHELSEVLSELLNKLKIDWFPTIEISWPDLYCYQRKNVGFMILDPRNVNINDKFNPENFPLIHFPGFCYLYDKTTDKIDVKVVQHADGPKIHSVPSEQH